MNTPGFSALRSWLIPLLTTAVLFISATGSFAQAEQSSPPAYSTIADLLENEQSRQALIQELRSLAADKGGELASSGAAQAAPSADTSLARQLAEAVSGFAGSLVTQMQKIWTALSSVFTSAPAEGWNLDALVQATTDMGLIILAVILAFFIFRRLARPLFSRLSSWSLYGGGKSALLRVLVTVFLAALADALVVVLAYITGNFLATFAIGEAGALPTRIALFLNAFLVVELFKAAIRMLFSSRYSGLRLIPIRDEEAEYWNRRLARLSGFIGYGLLFAVPLIRHSVSPALAQAVNFLVMLGAFAYVLRTVLANRVKLRNALDQKAQASTLGISRISLHLLSRIWHIAVLAYFLAILNISILRPGDALPVVMLATVKTLVFVGIGLILSGILSQLIGRRIVLTEELRDKIPLLETRLNAYIPNILKVIRAVILAAVVLFILDAWGLFDVGSWYASPGGRNLIGKVFSVAVILIVALAVWVALASVIEHFLNPRAGRGEPTARAKTLISLFRNALAITLMIMTGMIVLAEIGINIGPLIAGAGVLGLAIGFGAQKLVQDIITGVFIQIDNAMNTGDVVTAGGITGVAERLSIRSVGLRDLSGTYHIVPFSSVGTVSNFMRDFAFHVGEYGIAYRESIDEAVSCLREAFDQLAVDEEFKDHILAPLEVSGVTALADSSVNIRVRIMTSPGMQWAVGRAYNRLVKLHFDAAGIEIPFPHTTLYFGQEKDGSAPPAYVHLLGNKETGAVRGESGHTE
ncbi:mechanosensitive ion channel domain-containing protein [Desulfovermiculus halophilus]|uniref:mechanosensitive ion channel domain-containing protein n=1 Tax=Desulfovermiculus halophilus TaxID=339722 RepID=UPI0006854452|nr:mechanosensitive ion channel domain-containing protein [Desulfovermiculus halophilus]